MNATDVRNIYCIGRNYAEHAKELGNEVPTEPVVFLKPSHAATFHGDGEGEGDGDYDAKSGVERPGVLKLPAISQDVHHEVELVLVMGKRKGAGSRNSADSGEPMIAAFAVGIDVTARDLQTTAKKKGLPWVLAKGLKGFAPMGNLVAATGVHQGSANTGAGFLATDFANFEVAIEIDGRIQQKGTTKDLIFPIPQLIAYLDENFGLGEGDLIFTGTPPGVSRLQAGQKIHAWVHGPAGKSELRLTIL